MTSETWILVILELFGKIINTHADIRLEQFLRAPPIIPTSVDVTDSNPPRESEDLDIFDTSATDAFRRLIAAIDNPSPTPLEIDEQLYSALSGLSSSHPWSTLTLDLKGACLTLTDIFTPPPRWYATGHVSRAHKDPALGPTSPKFSGGHRGCHRSFYLQL